MLVPDVELVSAYASLGESVDRIACFKTVRQRFMDQLPNHLRAEEGDALVWRLFQLRKAGKLIVRKPEK
jgi:hypothetical protein